MPLYEYRCQSCGRNQEVLQKMSDPPLKVCEVCGGEMKRLVSAPAVQFKGTGWYVTDYAKKSGDGGSGRSSGGSSADKDKGGSSSESGSSSASSPSSEGGSSGEKSAPAEKPASSDKPAASSSGSSTSSGKDS